MCMTDAERIQEILKSKGLNNVQFCSATGISPASLSHILSGRSNPTLAILRNVVSGFPDLNPAWVMLGEGEMYRSAAADGEPVAASAPNAAAGAGYAPAAGAADDGLGIFAPIVEETAAGAPSYGAVTAAGAGFGGGAGRSALGTGGQTGAHGAAHAPQMGGNGRSAAVGQPSASDLVREVVAQMQRPVRKVVEVRVFFDDGTYESFTAQKS